MDDLLKFDHLLTEDERFIKDNVARFVEEKALALLNDAFEKGKFPLELVQGFQELGLFGLTLPLEEGGAGASYLAYGLICEELEKGDSGLRSFVSVQNSLCIEALYRLGSQEQKKTYLKDMINGKLIACFGLTEPDSGSDPKGMKTFAKKVSKGYEISGNKMWITNATIAGLAVVWANTQEGIRGFLMPTKTKGFTVSEIHHKMSLRASITGELAFDQVFVPDDHLLPGSEAGLKTALNCLNQARFGIAWWALGAAMACFDITLEYLLTRKQGKKELAGKQLIQQKLADLYSSILQAQAFNYRMTQLKEQQQENPAMISIAKREACRTALNVARTCRNLLGANGISLEYHVIRHMLNLESVFTYEGTDEVHTLVIGRHLTGINAF